MRRRRKVPDVIRRGLRLSVGLAICNSLGFAIAHTFGREHAARSRLRCPTGNVDFSGFVTFCDVLHQHVLVVTALMLLGQLERPQLSFALPAWSHNGRAASEHALLCDADLAPRLGNNIVQGAKWASITCIVVSAPVTGRVAQVSLERTLGTVTGGLLGECTCDCFVTKGFENERSGLLACAVRSVFLHCKMFGSTFAGAVHELAAFMQSPFLGFSLNRVFCLCVWPRNIQCPG